MKISKSGSVLLAALLLCGAALTGCDNSNGPEEHEDTKSNKETMAVENDGTVTGTNETSDVKPNGTGTTSEETVQDDTPHEHSFSEWKEDMAATCTEKGTEKRTCVCGESESREVDAKGHQMVDGKCKGCGKEESKGLQFTSNDDGTCYVSGIGTCTDTEIVIPSVSPAGDSVTSIGILGNATIEGAAFLYCRSLTSIEIPDSVTSIGDLTFYYCSSLTSIKIPDSVTSIGSSAFSGCDSLMSIEIPDSVTSIGHDAFAFCSGLKNVEIPDGVTCIDYHGFYYCSGLTSIEIPDSVTSIDYGAFYECKSLTSITFDGTKEEWRAIVKDNSWNANTASYTVHCTDGDLSKSES